MEKKEAILRQTAMQKITFKKMNSGEVKSELSLFVLYRIFISENSLNVMAGSVLTSGRRI